MSELGSTQTRAFRWLAPLLLALAAGALPQAASPAAARDPLVPAISTGSNPPACRVADTPTKFTRTADWSRTLVDWTFRVPSTYRPLDLVPVSRAGISGGGYVRAGVIPDLKAMVAAARKAGPGWPSRAPTEATRPRSGPSTCGRPASATRSP